MGGFDIRMNAKIAEFPAKILYESKLRDHDSVRDRLLKDIVNGIGPLPVESI
jgi:superfamily I DNA and/or RNA helicase